MIGPEPQEHRALQHELVADFRDAEAVKEALQAVARQKALVVVPRLPGSVEQPRADGCREVRDGAHGMASRYGCMTRVTRQMRA